jgi:DNA-binding MarR family transcriptional regulator
MEFAQQPSPRGPRYTAARRFVGELVITDALEDEIVVALRRIVRAIDLHSRRIEQSSGVTGPQLIVLREIERLGTSTVGALARAASLTQPTVSGIVERLERSGAITRTPGKEDRRTTVIRTTARGRALLAKAPALLQDRVRAELGRLDAWERTQVLSVLQRVAAMMDAEELDAAPVLEVSSNLAAGPSKTRKKPKK